MFDDELYGLAKDIAENELQHGVVLWTPEEITKVGRKGPKEVYRLDGRNRLEAIERNFKNDPKQQAEAIEGALYISQQQGCATLLYGDTDPFSYVVSANIHRRHLSRDEKSDLIVALLKANPEKSDRQIAKAAKASPTKVGTVRAGLEQSGDVSKLDTRTDIAGRQQPSTKPPKAPSKEAWHRAMREQQVERPISKAGTTEQQAPSPDRFRVADELQQVLTVLRGDRTRIAQFSLAKRVALARGCLMVLDVGLDDLQPIGDAP
jgi:hypothetical protein